MGPPKNDVNGFKGSKNWGQWIRVLAKKKSCILPQGGNLSNTQSQRNLKTGRLGPYGVANVKGSEMLAQEKGYPLHNGASSGGVTFEKVTRFGCKMRQKVQPEEAGQYKPNHLPGQPYFPIVFQKLKSPFELVRD